MKIVLLIILCLVLLAPLLLFLPLNIDLSCVEDDLFYTAKCLGIRVLDSEDGKKKKRKKRKDKAENQGASQDSDESDKFLKKLISERGFGGAIKYCFDLLGLFLKNLQWIVKHFKFRKLKLDITVATDNAANTAIEYGGVCSAVYPIIAFLESNADFKSKHINVTADFDSSEPHFSAYVLITAPIIWFLVALFEVYKLDYNDKESENYERQQH